YDNPDGVFGTGDELTITVLTGSYQHSGSSGTVCNTFYYYVPPGVASISFHNFDMDDNGALRYYAHSDTFDPTATTGGIVGTRSSNGVWNNGGSSTTRAGDTIMNPESGYWRVALCINVDNQYSLEGPIFGSIQDGGPPSPVLD